VAILESGTLLGIPPSMYYHANLNRAIMTGEQFAGLFSAEGDATGLTKLRGIDDPRVFAHLCATFSDGYAHHAGVFSDAGF
jgi:hypothetical protein